MRIFALAMLLVSACGTAAGSTALAPPSPPTAALAAWKSFPANANPRPIISFGETTEHIQASGFPTGDRKIAWLCNKFVLAGDVKLSTIVPGNAFVAGNRYPSIGSETAYSELMAARAGGGNPTDCAKAQPFVITAARWATAGFPTDRGTMQMTAWLFDIPEVNAYIGHSAVATAAYWGGGVATGGGHGGRISADGMTLTIGVVGGPDTPGPCGEDFAGSVAESDTAVAVAISSRTHGGEGVVCTLEGHFRTVVLHLAKPIGGRVLLDEKGNPGAVCPETGDC